MFQYWTKPPLYVSKAGFLVPLNKKFNYGQIPRFRVPMEASRWSPMCQNDHTLGPSAGPTLQLFIFQNQTRSLIPVIAYSHAVTHVFRICVNENLYKRQRATILIWNKFLSFTCVKQLNNLKYLPISIITIYYVRMDLKQ